MLTVIQLFAALTLLSVDVVPVPATTPAPPARRVAQVAAIAGLPSEEDARAAFMTAFRAAFDTSSVGIEAASGDGFAPAGTFENQFRLADSTAGDAWQVNVVLGVPRPMTQVIKELRAGGSANPRRRAQAARAPLTAPGDPLAHVRRASRGLAVTVSVSSPVDARSGVVSPPESVGLALAVPSDSTTAGERLVPSGGYQYPWDLAGREAAIAVLERLHRASGDLPGNERFDVSPAIRTAAGR